METDCQALKEASLKNILLTNKLIYENVGCLKVHTVTIQRIVSLCQAKCWAYKNV